MTTVAHGLLAWLLSPLSGAAEHTIQPWAYWHARCMVLGWGLLLPAGALAARYFKVLPGQRWPQQLDSRVWWRAHRGLQWAGVLVMTLGAVLAWGQGSRGTLVATAHAWAGWVLIVLGWFQVLAGLVRGSKGGPSELSMRGDHYDMTPHRLRFERLHKSVGWVAVLAAIAVIALGLKLSDAPRWMPLLLTGWWALLALLAMHWQRQGRCVDTYQAIWGPDSSHPGNRLRPIGWGVHRPLD